MVHIGKYFSHFKRYFSNNELEMLTFFITSKCNASCIHCFYADNLNKKDDLSLDEIKKTINSMPNVRTVLFSGGEPFLQSKLSEISEEFYTKKNTKIFAIPTNGLLHERILSISEDILRRCPGVILNINFSLDGMQNMHDKIRNVPGNFDKLINSIQTVQILRQKYNNFFINVNSVITPMNYLEMYELTEFVKTLNIDTHSLEVIRPDILGGPVELPPKDELIKIYKHHINNNFFYFDKLLKRRNFSFIDKFIHKIFYVGKNIYLHKNQLRVISGKKLTMYCKAGIKAASIHANGRVGVCELLPPLDNLKNTDFDFKKILTSDKASNVIKKIKDEHCSCTHCVFLHKSMEASPSVSFFKIPLSYFMFRLFKVL